MSSDSKKDRKKKMMARIREVEEILREWDPMDLAPGKLAPADEYDGYAPHIVSQIEQGCSAEQLLKHLQELRSGMVCMRKRPEHDMEMAHKMIAKLRKEVE